MKDLFSFLSVSQCIIYCNSVKRVQDLYEAMKEDAFPVCRLHSGMDKTERAAAFTEFKSGASRVLISSNVTARGIDVQQVMPYASLVTIETEVKRAMGIMAPGGGFIFAPSHNIQADVSPDRIHKTYDTALRFRTYAH